MSLSIVLRRTAQLELQQASAWYEERQSGLGDDLGVEVQKVLDLIVDHPDRYPIAAGKIRQAPVSRFPYCVYYKVRADRLIVVGVVHNSRDPSIWQRRR